MSGEGLGGGRKFTRRLLGSPSVMVLLQTKASGDALEDHETRALVGQTHATSKITMCFCDGDQSCLDRPEASLKCAAGDCITKRL